jgi:signal transduction histidine kinase
MAPHHFPKVIIPLDAYGIFKAMKFFRVGGLRPVFKPKKYTAFVAILIVITGIASGLFAAITSGLQQREYLVGRAQTIANTIPTEEISTLKGRQSDKDLSGFKHISQSLRQVTNSNTDVARIHLFIIRNGHIQVGADALSPTNPNYVPPGLTYLETTEPLRASFKTTEPRFDTYVSNNTGRFVAAYTPVYDVQTAKIVGVIGIYKSASAYYQEILLYAIVPLLLAAIPLVGILRDIKIQAKEHEILQLKNQFVSIASHELRSPLTGMLWGIQVLQQDEKKFSLKQRGLLHDMYLSTESSISTVNEILDLSIFERAEGHALQREKVDMSAVATQVISTLKLGAQEKNIEIHKNGTWPEPMHVLGDVGALKRGLMNIVANAIKYTHEHDTVVLTYRKSPEGEHIISIQDHGIGIPHEEQRQVLKGYYRASNASKVQAHGTGLGLWLTRKIILEHGGRLWLNSKEGKGTTIFVALPDAEKTTKRQQPVKSAGSNSLDQDS